jgi:hypothetical protein
MRNQCKRCGKNEDHYVGPSLTYPGFYRCEPVKDDPAEFWLTAPMHIIEKYAEPIGRAHGAGQNTKCARCNRAQPIEDCADRNCPLAPGGKWEDADKQP